MNPIRSLEEHSKEVASVDWNCTHTDRFLSSSWDDTIKLWSVNQPQSLRTFARHQHCVYCVRWCASNVAVNIPYDRQVLQ